MIINDDEENDGGKNSGCNKIEWKRSKKEFIILF